MSENLNKYREGLIETQQKLNESYDKLLITLSGGSLALSITFLKDVIGLNDISHTYLLLIAWGLFVLSITSILGEILFGIKAYKKAIKQIDNDTIYEEKVGGKSSSLSSLLHYVAAISLVLGLIFISVFTFFNIGEKNVGREASTEATTESTASTKTEANTRSGAETTHRRRAGERGMGATTSTKP